MSKFETRPLTGTGTFRGDSSVSIKNTGASAAVVAGKSIAAGDNIDFKVMLGGTIEFEYNAASTTLESTSGGLVALDPIALAPIAVVEEGVPEGTVFTVTDNETDAGFATYAGYYYDSGETGGKGETIFTNGTRAAMPSSGSLWDATPLSFFPSIAEAQSLSSQAYESDQAGDGDVSDNPGTTVRGTIIGV